MNSITRLPVYKVILLQGELTLSEAWHLPNPVRMALIDTTGLVDLVFVYFAPKMRG